MSAESPRRGVHKGTQIISPQPIIDRSIINNVAVIINDIVPQGYTGGIPGSDNKETISWARFEYADINDPIFYPEYDQGSSTPPLLLVLGYATGVQVWLIPATGEATEVLSWRQGIVRTLRILPNPKTDDEHVDPFGPKRPLVAICDSAGPGPQFCNISFVSLKTGEQAKSIKFKNPVCDILANRRSVVVTFVEKIAVFDARTLEDTLTVTTCYASPGPNPNPVALGTRWLAYSEKKLLPTRRSSGGCEGDGVQSYTATVLYAAKSLGKGLRELGETVASSLTGTSVSPMAVNNMGNDVTQPGVVTILDLQAAKDEKELDDPNIETIIAHFTAHSDAIVAMTFDLTGALLMTADKRGHDFHVFRIHPHPGGPTLAAVHHLYILHRGDTTAKVQDMVFSSDARWAAISTVRGTTHVFPVAPYGGPVGVRTHSTPHVVNRLSRFHKSAGLTDDATRSHSPISHVELPLAVYPYSNPRLPPYPHPTILHPLSQIRQSSLNVNNSSQPRTQQRQQRSYSDDNGTVPLTICACFAPPRAWIYTQRESSSKVVKKAVDSLFIMAYHGIMIQYDLEPKPAAGVPKEKVCDDTMIELDVEAKGQWPFLRSPNSSEIIPPLPLSSPLLNVSIVPKINQELDTAEDRWLSQVEIVTHAGPHRRLWMGPQFIFKTYNVPSGVAVNLAEAEAIEIGVTGGSRPARSNPVNMPHAASRPLMPVVIDGSGSSYEQSPRFMEAYGDPLDSENVGITGSGENQLREDLAEAMLETSIAPHRAPGRRSVFERVGQPITKVVNPLGTVITISADEEDANFSLEFDFAEGSLVPGPPRSVCAEEGPASLGDLEPESQTLRELTEICAEMSLANEPAIDSIPDENICELKECKTLCAEMATMGGVQSSSIDFEKEEAFRDVPTSLSLCAEQGEIPNSPMTQAKEAIWRKRSGTTDDNEIHETNISRARYVVNYSDDTVVLMENKMLHERNVETSSTEKHAVLQMPNVTKVYCVKKSDDLRKGDIDYKSTCVRKNTGYEKESEIDKKVKSTQDTIKIVKEKSKIATCKKKSKMYARQEFSNEHQVTSEGKNLMQEDIAHLIKPYELESDVSVTVEKQVKPAMEVKTEVPAEETFQVLDAPSSDDSSFTDFLIIEPGKDTSSSNQSDDDTVHVCCSEAPHIGESEFDGTNRRKPVSGLIPIHSLKRSSRHIVNPKVIDSSHRKEVTMKSFKVEKDQDNSSFIDRNYSKHTNSSSSSDDLEHTEIQELNQDTLYKAGTSQKSAMIAEKMQTGCSSMQQSPKFKSGKRWKDAVTIEGDVSILTAEGTMSSMGKTVGKSPSPTRKIKSHTSKTSCQMDTVKVMDTDAMQKAEMETAAGVSITSEYPISSSSSDDISGACIRKYSRKDKKLHPDEQPQCTSTDDLSFQSLKVKLAELQEAVDEIISDSNKSGIQTTIDWNSIVKKVAPLVLEARKKMDIELLTKIEEKIDVENIKKLIVTQDSEPHTKDFTPESTESAPANEAVQRMSAKVDKIVEMVKSLDPFVSITHADEEELSYDNYLTCETVGQIKNLDEDTTYKKKEDVLSAKVPAEDKRFADETRQGNEAKKKESSLQFPERVKNVFKGSFKKEIDSSVSLTLKEVLQDIETVFKSEKDDDSKEEIIPERLSSSLEELNVAIVHGGESSQPRVLSVMEKNKQTKTSVPVNTGKKGNKSKKKKRR